MKKLFILMAALTAGYVGAFADDVYDDDIYYNPKKEKSAKKTPVVKSGNESYDAGGYSGTDIDVDAYNRRGTYYETAIDTIGNGVSGAEDFVYTRQIQKYYNPTIVVDNAGALADVINNSYGNVNIVIDNGVLGFAPYSYTYMYGYPYYSYAWSSPWSWNYYPSWSWTWGSAWGPTWSYYPGYNWGWGPSWGWGWTSPGHGWAPGHHNHWAQNHYRPNGNTVNRPGNNGSYTRPGINGNHSNVGNNRVPSNSYRPNNGAAVNTGGYNYNNHRQTGTPANRVGGNTNVGSGNRGTTTNSYRPTNSSGNSYNRGSSTGTSTRSYNSGSSTRSSGGGMGTTRSTGGGGNRGGGGGGGGHR